MRTFISAPFAGALVLLGFCLLGSPASVHAQDGVPGSKEDTGGAKIGDRLDKVLSGESGEESAPAEETGTDGAATEETTTDEAPDTAATDEAATGEAATGETTMEPAAPAAQPAAPGTTNTAATDQPAATGETAPAEASPATPPADETPEQKGLRLAQEAEKQNEGWRWQTASGRMILRDSQGNTNERAFESRILEDQNPNDNEGARGIIVFLLPPDIKNTALLTIGQRHDDDYQWLYLPALKRVKRISGTSKTGSFVGSEFSYEDLSAAAIEDYTYLWMAEEPCPGAEDLTCNVIERRPKDDESGYSRIVVWQEVGKFRIYKSDFYDRKGSLLKTLTITRHELFKDRYWRVMDMTMVNHVNGKSTQMTWSNYNFDMPLAEADFTVRALERLQ